MLVEFQYFLNISASQSFNDNRPASVCNWFCTGMAGRDAAAFRGRSAMALSHRKLAFLL
jgi:hypothetical protein